jgi:hypothetical protein
MKIMINKNCNPVLAEIMSQFTAGKKPTLVTVCEDYITSTYCLECNGDGISLDDGEQCLSCEELHQQELRADRMMDAIKEGE